jgi:RNA polymerase sigma-70 factor, ECF subfamily
VDAVPTDPATFPDTSSDAELVDAARRDPAAFDALYRRYLPGVYRYVLARVGSVPPAEDVTAAVFMDALVGLRHYREQGRFTAWLYTIARRRVFAHRRQAARLAPLDRADLGVAGESEDVERVALLFRAMAELTDERREALALRFFAGLKVSEVAQAMGKGESAVKMLLHRGLAQLREILSEDDVVR